MVRDVESLIEFLYLSYINNPLASSMNVIVNPISSDNILGKTCIINKSYEIPDLSLSNRIISRFEDNYRTIRNPFIKHINVVDSSIFIIPDKNIFYFGDVPDEMNDPCYNYLRYQLATYNE